MAQEFKKLFQLGSPGLVLTDVEPRLYDGAGLRELDTSSLALDPVSGSPGSYVLSASLAKPSAGRWSITISWPLGFGTAFSWPDDQAPVIAVAPVRQTGLAGSVTAALFRDATPTLDSLTISEATVGEGDYLVSGWTAGEKNGRYELSLAYGGFGYSAISWFDVGPVPDLSPVGDAIDYAAQALFATIGDLGKVTLRRYIRTPNPQTGRTAKALVAGFPKSVPGIIGRRMARNGSFEKRLFVQGSSFGQRDLPEGEWTVQEGGSGSEIPLLSGFTPLGPRVQGVAMWIAHVGGGGARNA